MFEVKNYVESDFKSLFNIHRNAFRSYSKKESLDDFKKSIENTVGKVLVLQNEIIGAIFLEAKDIEGEFKVKKLFITPKYQNKGLGYFILTHLKEEDEAIKSIELEISEENLKTKKFCEKMLKEI
ncbi:GNAT family N-acetyltransferase [Cetobacterium sp.]|uniref:GNAT family N-acetyltransferase n=1 Tax=Cetobacterium sp. TaxID=2071632 RepID=UPI0025D85C46|nr:GNAT family N-acetyltransferase [uncultured Cetobacterium sp.]